MAAQAQSQGDAFDVREEDVPPAEWLAFTAALDTAQRRAGSASSGGQQQQQQLPEAAGGEGGGGAGQYTPWWLSAEGQRVRLGPRGQAIVAVLDTELDATAARVSVACGSEAPPPQPLTEQAGEQRDGAAGAGAGCSASLPLLQPQLPAPPDEPLPPLPSLSRAPPSPLLRVRGVRRCVQ